MKPGGHTYKFSKQTFQLIARERGLQPIYQANVPSPFREIWGKAALTYPERGARLLYQFSIGSLLPLAGLLRQGNRLFIILRKV